ncbi:hypothetical protein [Actinoplanes sp. NPDC049265]|uniref:hypothetical protein n=1 Tax=Actinoplanes sp. NPDC049265 TaxID=3363902 RepID=UPI0037170198
MAFSQYEILRGLGEIVREVLPAGSSGLRLDKEISALEVRADQVGALMGHVASRFGVPIDVDDVSRFRTVGELVSFIQGHQL